MLITSEYNNGIDECWFDSSSIIYTKFTENANDNNGQLIVVFKGGATYLYKEVNMPFNYLQFKHGMKENSAGKSLNSFIKPYYEYEKIDNLSLEEIEARKQQVLNDRDTSNTAFISGHRDITQNEFDSYYVPRFIDLSNGTSNIVLGDCEGLDIMAQNYLIDVLNIDPNRITIYYVGNEPQNINPLITRVKGNFKDYIDADTAMTNASSFDIAFIRKDKENSNTARNILRRYLMA